jgi:hypothetical protein
MLSYFKKGKVVGKIFLARGLEIKTVLIILEI